jgi:hypothetical protein
MPYCIGGNSMEKQWTVTLQKDLNNNSITFKELYESILEEIDNYERLGMLDELMNQKVVLDLVDYDGQVLHGDATLFVGFLEGGSVLLTGNLKGVYATKNNN